MVWCCCYQKTMSSRPSESSYQCLDSGAVIEPVFKKEWKLAVIQNKVVIMLDLSSQHALFVELAR